MDRNAPRAHPQQALAVYVEPLAVGRRVVVIGDSSLGLGARLAELGARAVCVWDPDPARARREADRAPSGVTVRAFVRDSASEGLRTRGQYVDEMDERSGAFDLAVVANLELFDDAEDLLARVRRLVGDHGVALVAAPNRDGTANPDAFDYYELFDLVAREFEDVTMIAQLPFFGVALAELGDRGDESPTVSVDTQLAGGDRSPDAFVALASQRGVRLDPYAIVELAARPPDGDEEIVAEEVEILRASLAEARLRADAVEAQVLELASRFAEAEREALAAQNLLEEALRDRSLRVLELESALGQGNRQLTQLSDELESVRVSMQGERVGAAQLQALVLRAEHAELALRSFEPELARIGEAHALEVAQYEAGLRDRAKELRAFQVELDRRERMVRDLVDTLEDGAYKSASAPTLEQQRAAEDTRNGEAGGDSPEDDLLADKLLKLQQKLDALALELARREGEAQANAWTIAELERRLESGPVAAQGAGASGVIASDGVAESRLAAALDELDVLRRALAQEHEARVRAESNQKFPPAGADVREQ